MKHFIFSLSMPCVGSWNGRWTGEGKNYVKGRSFKNSDARLDNFKEDDYWYDFGDGWSACVTVEEVTAREKTKANKTTDGFWGYDWMIDSIIENGEIISGS